MDLAMRISLIVISNLVVVILEIEVAPIYEKDLYNVMGDNH